MSEFRQKLTMNVDQDPNSLQPELPASKAASDGAPRPDMRGQGGVTDSGEYVRPCSGSSRPPHVDSQVWAKCKPLEKAQFIQDS